MQLHMPRLALGGSVLALAWGLATGCRFTPVPDEIPETCKAWTTASCGCANGETGTQLCLSDGKYGHCSCELACIPGRSENCLCTDGQRGAVVCSQTGEFGDCSCVTAADAGVPDGGAPDGGDDQLFHSGPETLIDFFPAAGGTVVVVTDQSVELIDPDGNTNQRVATPRANMAAAFDGTLLGVADGAMVLAYDSHLVQRSSVALVEPCASAVLVSGERFVCGPESTWDRMFAIYDLARGKVLNSQAGSYTYQGVPMRLVPGTDVFLTIDEDTSGQQYYALRVTADSKLVEVGESPWDQMLASRAISFDADPPKHVVSPQGILLKVDQASCGETYSNDCLARDGELGTLAVDSGQYFVAQADDGAGMVYALLARGGQVDSRCMYGCAVQRIDIAARRVVAESSATLVFNDFVAARFDPVAKRFLVGYPMIEGGYRIDRFELP